MTWGNRGALCGAVAFVLACANGQTNSANAVVTSTASSAQSSGQDASTASPTVASSSSEPAPSATIATHGRTEPNAELAEIADALEARDRIGSLDIAPSARPTTSPPTSARPPSGSVQLSGASVTGGAVSNAAAVVAGMAAGFRRCYNKGLNDDPHLQGSVTITAQIGPNGEVLSAKPSRQTGLSGTVISCVAARVSSAQFAPPDKGTAKIVIPISFIPP